MKSKKKKRKLHLAFTDFIKTVTHLNSYYQKFKKALKGDKHHPVMHISLSVNCCLVVTPVICVLT